MRNQMNGNIFKKKNPNANSLDCKSWNFEKIKLMRSRSHSYYKFTKSQILYPRILSGGAISLFSVSPKSMIVLYFWLSIRCDVHALNMLKMKCNCETCMYLLRFFLFANKFLFFFLFLFLRFVLVNLYVC